MCSLIFILSSNLQLNSLILRSLRRLWKYLLKTNRCILVVEFQQKLDEKNFQNQQLVNSDMKVGCRECSSCLKATKLLEARLK